MKRKRNDTAKKKSKKPLATRKPKEIRCSHTDVSFSIDYFPPELLYYICTFNRMAAFKIMQCCKEYRRNICNMLYKDIIVNQNRMFMICSCHTHGVNSSFRTNSNNTYKKSTSYENNPIVYRILLCRVSTSICIGSNFHSGECSDCGFLKLVDNNPIQSRYVSVRSFDPPSNIPTFYKKWEVVVLNHIKHEASLLKYTCSSRLLGAFVIFVGIAYGLINTLYATPIVESVIKMILLYRNAGVIVLAQAKHAFIYMMDFLPLVLYPKKLLQYIINIIDSICSGYNYPNGSSINLETIRVSKRIKLCTFLLCKINELQHAPK